MLDQMKGSNFFAPVIGKFEKGFEKSAFHCNVIHVQLEQVFKTTMIAKTITSLRLILLIRYARFYKQHKFFSKKCLPVSSVRFLGGM